MHATSLRQGARAAALALLTLAATLASAGCGKGDAGPTGPVPSDPSSPSEPSDPSTPSEPSDPEPPPVGWSIYAVDLTNHFLLFGSESPTVLNRKLKVTGLPVLHRIIGIAFRPKDGKLYGVGNDSRVYTIDTLTAVATPVGSGPFSPKIASFFDIHFAMALEPNGDRVRLIAAESGGNWSISLDDGTATLWPNAHYAPGTPYAGQRPGLMGMAYAPRGAAATLRTGAARVSLSPPIGGECENLMYAVDADRSMMLSMCDPDTGEFAPAGDLPLEEYARCGELLMTPDPTGGSGPGGEPGGEPGSDLPPGPLSWGYEVGLLMMRGMNGLNSYGTLEEDGSLKINWRGLVAADPIQTADSDFKVGGKYGPRRSPLDPKVSTGVVSAERPSSVAQCPLSGTT